MGLRDWVSEKVTSTDYALTYLPGLQWGSETGSRRRPGWVSMRTALGLLQWGSETGSRRRGLGLATPIGKVAASMGLRDWVSEKAVGAAAAVRGAIVLQWGSETGSRRRATAAMWLVRA